MGLRRSPATWGWWLLLTLVPAATVPAATGTLERIAVGKTIRIAYAAHARPLSFKDAEGIPRGYAVDLCRQVVAGIQRDLDLDALEIAWLEGNPPRRLAAVVNGEADLDCGTTALTLTHQAQVDFSSIVFVESGALLTRRTARIATLADLAGRRIGVVPQTTTEQRLRALLARDAQEATLLPIRDAWDGRERLLANELDAVAGDRLVLQGQLSGAGEALSLLEPGFSAEPYAFALPRNDADFRLAVNRALAGLYRDGGVDRIYARWFGADAEPDLLLQTVWFIYGFAD